MVKLIQCLKVENIAFKRKFINNYKERREMRRHEQPQQWIIEIYQIRT